MKKNLLFYLLILLISCTPEKEQKKYYAFEVVKTDSYKNTEGYYKTENIDIKYQGKVSLIQFENNCKNYKIHAESNTAENILNKEIISLKDSLKNLKYKNSIDRTISIQFCKINIDVLFELFFLQDRVYIICEEDLIEKVKKNPLEIIAKSDNEYFNKVKIYFIPHDNISDKTREKFINLWFKFYNL